MIHIRRIENILHLRKKNIFISPFQICYSIYYSQMTNRYAFLHHYILLRLVYLSSFEVKDFTSQKDSGSLTSQLFFFTEFFTRIKYFALQTQHVSFALHIFYTFKIMQ